MFGCLGRIKAREDPPALPTYRSAYHRLGVVGGRPTLIDGEGCIFSAHYGGQGVFLQSDAAMPTTLERLDEMLQMEAKATANQLVVCFEGALENADTLKEALWTRRPELQATTTLSPGEVIGLLVAEKRSRGVGRQASIEMLRMELAGQWSLSIVDPQPFQPIRLYALTSTQGGLLVGRINRVTWFDTTLVSRTSHAHLAKGELAVIEPGQTTFVSTTGAERVVLRPDPRRPRQPPPTLEIPLPAATL